MKHLEVCISTFLFFFFMFGRGQQAAAAAIGDSKGETCLFSLDMRNEDATAVDGSSFKQMLSSNFCAEGAQTLYVK